MAEHPSSCLCEVTDSAHIVLGAHHIYFSYATSRPSGSEGSHYPCSDAHSSFCLVANIIQA
ncbi:hypothetical protein PAXRUDRAFT_686839 [Paxillus rubicundulus Ve08.2h10]|uniref:Uncharacterized protein n=1 Tax=Paxillus rubicundulus Ve08.2h10 TaxID=930991 RepID=A0A0D0DV24_9AGAM|nr:hypothetical protein PAXRUDRAFT_686839 [Paxillus rubicundulus Ve08.2h10]